MKNRIFILLVLTFLLLFNGNLYADEIDAIKKNYIQAILDDKNFGLTKELITHPKETFVSDRMVIELMQRYPMENADVMNLLNTQQSDGSWSDINYSLLSGDELTRHLDRLFMLCKQFRSEKTEFYKSPQLAKTISKAMDFWFMNKFEAVEVNKRGITQRNWWYNDIGIPKTFASSFVLFEDHMSISQIAEAIEVMKVSKIGTTGQNKVWLAGNVLVRGLLENNFHLVRQARDSIASEIIYGPSGPRQEGIQYDYSYHQHGHQQQFGNYGAAYIADMSFWNKVLAGTSIAFEQEKLDILSELISNGFHRILWKGYMDVNGLGRQFFRQSQLHKALAVGFSANALADVDVKNREKYKMLLEDNFLSGSEKPHLTGLYHFWNSDQTIYRRPQWMASVRMSSMRTLGGEAGNGDNKKGYYMSDGSAYIYVDGDEYDDIFPVWDWRKLPGVTAYETDAPFRLLTFAGYRSQGHFVGNVSDGQTGMTVMHLVRDRLSALKAWIFTDNYVFCFGTGITTESDSVVTTAIEQKLKKADLMELKASGWNIVEKSVLSDVKDARFFHDKTGYIILQAENAFATDESRTGSWYDVMGVYPKDMMATEDVVSLWINHGNKPHDASYQYLVLPATTSQKVASFDLKEIEVFSNTQELQAVYLPKEKTIFIAAFSPVAKKLPMNIDFKCWQPGLYMIKYKSVKEPPEVIYNDPTQLLESVEYEINGNKTHVNLELSN